MNKSKIIAGIDIGSCKIATIIASLSEESDKVSVIGASSLESKGLKKSQVVDIEEAIEAIAACVEATERMAGCSLSSAFISVGGTHVHSQNSKGVVAVANPEEEITSNDVNRVIEAAQAISLPSSREVVHVIPREFKLDSQEGIKDPLGMTGVRLEAEAHIVSGSSTAMRNLAKCINEVGVEINGLVFSGLAAAEACLTETEKELGVCLVDIGGGTTSIAIFTNNSLAYSSVLPVGAKNITNDIAIGLRVSLETAEKIKIALSSRKKEEILDLSEKKKDEIDPQKLGINEKTGKISYKTLVMGIIRPRLNEIFSLIGEELKRSGFGGATPAGVVLCGGGAETIGISDACKGTLSLPVRVASLSKLSGLVEEVSGCRFAVSHGLILYGIRNMISRESSFSFNNFGKIFRRIPVRGSLAKTIEFIKSFLP